MIKYAISQVNGCNNTKSNNIRQIKHVDLKEIIIIIKDYLRKIETKGLHISKAYLYGSQVKGMATKDSDIDLMLVSPLFDDNADKYAGIIWFSASEVSYKIEPITVGEKKFLSDVYSPLIGIVKKEGIEIAA